jgi:glutaminyl-peptide cyclotransferase
MKISPEFAAQLSSVAMFRLLSLFGVFYLISFGAKSEAQAPVNNYQVVHVYPHDPEAFTQGLVFVDGHLY